MKNCFDLSMEANKESRDFIARASAENAQLTADLDAEKEARLCLE
jgi:hypothetical protein